MSDATFNVDTTKKHVHVTCQVSATESAPAKTVTYTLDFSNVSMERLLTFAAADRRIAVANVIRRKEGKTRGSGYKFASGTIDVADMGERKMLTPAERRARQAKDLGVDVKALEKFLAENASK